MSDRNAKTSKHFLRFSTDEFRGTGNDIFRLCMRNSSYQKGKSFLHHSVQEPFPPPDVACGGQEIGAFCHGVTQLFRHEGTWVKGMQRATFSSVTALAALTHRCTTGTAFVTWLISLCLLVLSTNFPSTRQYADFANLINI